MKTPRRPKPGDLVIDPLPPARTHPVSERLRQIYAEAARLFVEKGYDATSMSDIAQAVNITKAGLYHFVKSKEDLLMTIVTHGMDQLFDDVVEPARAVADPAERLSLIVRNHVMNIGRVRGRSGNPLTIIADDVSGLGGERKRQIDRRKREYFDLVRDTLGALQARGDIDGALDVTVCAHNLIGVILWTARWRRPEGRASRDDVAEQILAFVSRGVLARRPPDTSTLANLPTDR